MKKVPLSIIFCFFLVIGKSQVAWLVPSSPSVRDTVTLFFNAAEGNKNLKGHSGDVYLHAGIITNKSLDGHDWKYVVGNWGTADSRVVMKKVDKDLYSFRFIPAVFYGIKAEDKALQLSFVFRNLEGTLVGKTEQNEDILVPVEGYKPPEVNSRGITIPGQKLQELETKEYGWILHTDQGYILINPYTSNICEVEFFPSGKVTRDSSHAVILKPRNVIKKTVPEAVGYQLIAGDLSIMVHKDPLYLTWMYKSDTLFKEEKGLCSVQGNSGFRLHIGPGERVYGTGERSVPMDRIGYRYPLYNRPYYGYEENALMLNYSVPVTLSSRNYALLWDNPQKGYVDIGKTDKGIIEWYSIGGPARYLVVAGSDYPELMKNYTGLTGRQPLPPRWALGNLQSRMAYRNQKETDSIVTLMKDKGFPIDAIIIDFYWFGDSILGHLGTLDWYKKAWPDPDAMISKFKKMGVNTILITEPYIIDTMANFKVAADLGLFATDSLGRPYVNHQFYFGPGGLLDIFKPSVKDWFWEKYNNQIVRGVAAWWGDLGEPESHPSDIFHVNGKADEVHNIYGHYWDRMLFEKYSYYYPRTRLFHLQRSGYAGTQRYSAYPWTGDVSRSWGGYQAQLPLLLTMGLNGLGYIHSDAGGFAQGVKDEELYIRWLQFACFTPILRPHGSGIPSEPVFFNEKTQEIVKKYMKLRYSLLPYNYTLAYENAINGEPLMRPLFYYHPKDNNVEQVENEYYWGKNMLIAPVLNKGLSSQRIYLPEGEWLDFHTSETYQGNQWIDYKISLEEMPIFIKKGSIIPMTKVVSTIRDYDPRDISLLIYPDQKATSFSQFEDDGTDALSLMENNYEIIDYQCVPISQGYSITMETHGKWKGSPDERKMKLKFRYTGSTPLIKINGKIIRSRPPETGATDTAGFQYLEPWIIIDYPWNGRKSTVEIINKSNN